MIFLNGKTVEPTIFPDHTSQVWKLDEDTLAHADYALVVWDFQSEAEFMQLAQLKMLLDACALRTHLEISYLPYARQDKTVQNNATFALRSFAYLLNGLNFDEITIMDPHSSIATTLINNSKAFYPIDELAKVIEKTSATLVCYPDKGARTKYVNIYRDVVANEFIYGEKVRDQLTGHITKYDLVTGTELMIGHKVLIVDDICDGGATFQILAKSLYDAGAAEVSLFVSHGIFSKGISPLLESDIKHVYTPKGEVQRYSNDHFTFKPL